jgi:hypothetical protein
MQMHTLEMRAWRNAKHAPSRAASVIFHLNDGPSIWVICQVRDDGEPHYAYRLETDTDRETGQRLLDEQNRAGGLE